MLEIRLVLDDLDYDSLAEFLLPLFAEKLKEQGGFRAMIAKNEDALASFAKQLLSSMSQEKKDELLIQLLREKKGVVLTKTNEAADRRGIGARVLDLEVKKI